MEADKRVDSAQVVVALDMAADKRVDSARVIVVLDTTADSPELAGRAGSMAKTGLAEAMAVVPQPVAVAYRYRPLAALADHIASHNIPVARSALMVAGAVVDLRFPRCSFTTFSIQCNYIILRFRTPFVTILSCPYTYGAGSMQYSRLRKRAFSQDDRTYRPDVENVRATEKMIV